MRKLESNGLRSILGGNLGLVVMVMIAGGISIYAVADSRPKPMPDFVGIAEPLTSEQIKEIAAFDPFMPSKALAVKAPALIETTLVEKDGEVLIAVADLPETGSLWDSLGDEQPQMQLAQNTANGQASPKPAKKKKKRRGGGAWWKNSGNNSWILPTALIAGGVTGITIGTVAIVRNSNKSDHKKVALTR